MKHLNQNIQSLPPEYETLHR